MVLIFALDAKREASNEVILSWFIKMRWAAMEIPGVYDLALYGKELSPEDRYWCAIDVEDEASLKALWNDSQIQDALKSGERFGLRLVEKSSSNRLV
jgi:hypothetical protein